MAWRILIGLLIGTGVLIVQQNLLSLGGDWNKIILGSVLALVLIFWPTGLIGLFRLFWQDEGLSLVPGNFVFKNRKGGRHS